MVFGLAAVGAAAADERATAPFNEGEDFTRPRRQLNLKESYQRLPETKGLSPEKWTTTLRTDLWTGLGGGWLLYGRGDLPLVYTDGVAGSNSNASGQPTFGQGDVLTEFALVPPPPTPRVAYGFGMRIVSPTASLSETGSGTLQLGPVAGVRLSLPEISPGSYVLPIAIYRSSVASRDNNGPRPTISQLTIQPKFKVALSSDWYGMLYASDGQSIQLDFEKGAAFVPVDVQVGRRIGECCIATLEFAHALFYRKGFEPFIWSMEARIGYFF